jgi:hypothetical protein
MTSTKAVPGESISGEQAESPTPSPTPSPHPSPTPTPGLAEQQFGLGKYLIGMTLSDFEKLSPPASEDGQFLPVLQGGAVDSR